MRGTCQKCEFWMATGSIGDMGDCRHHSPVVFQRAPACDAEWPVTLIEDWCGDYVERVRDGWCPALPGHPHKWVTLKRSDGIFRRRCKVCLLQEESEI